LDKFGLLRNLYEDAVAWLKYAEAKNAALAALAAGSFYVALRLAVSDDNGPFVIISGISASCFALALLFAIISFLPITNPQFISLREMRLPETYNGNVFFFSDLARMSEDNLLTKLGISVASPSDNELLEPQIAHQIITNSQITCRKLVFFELGAWLYLAGLASPIVAFLLFWATGGWQRIVRVRCSTDR